MTYRRIWVLWGDSCGTPGWTDGLPRPVPVETLGWLTVDDPDHDYLVVTLSVSQCPEDTAEFNGSIAIPYSAILNWGWIA